MSWRVAASLLILRDQVNHLSPNRDKSSDGTIGDAAHASRASDHDPWVHDGKDGVVTAMDITNDPAHGIVSEELAEAIRTARDPRIKYVISNRKIANSEPIGAAAAWAWRPYSGANPHNHHVHISVKADKAHYDSTAPWVLDLKLPSAEVRSAPPPRVRPFLRIGSKGDPVKTLQALLGFAAKDQTGFFDDDTESAVKDFQKAHQLVTDGRVAAYTWNALLEVKTS